MRASILTTVIALLVTVLATTPARAAATPGGCGLPGYVSSVHEAPCRAAPTGARSSESLLGLLPDPVSGLLGGAVKSALSGIVSWADHGAANALRLTAGLIDATTAPSLRSSWFSGTYWRVATLSALLTVPFLFAAGIHALVRSDLGLLARAAFGYLPLAMLGVAIAAPLTALLLVGTDEMCGFVSAASSHADTDFLGRAATALSGASLLGADPFIVFFAALITVAATISLWLELLVRGAAVEVIALMLPLFFSAMVWPARRIWAIRAIETLIALILSKFAIVAVLALGGAAITHAGSGPSALLTGATIVLLTVFSPWALLRVLPLHEVASAAAGGLSRPPRDAVRQAKDLAMAGGRRGSRDGDAATDGPGDDRTAPLRRLAARADGVRTRLAAPAVVSHGGFGPVTDEGREAPSDADGGSSADHSAGAGAPTGTPPEEPVGDRRPPLARVFGPERWPEPLVLGQAGEDRIRPPWGAEQESPPVGTEIDGRPAPDSPEDGAASPIASPEVVPPRLPPPAPAAGDPLGPTEPSPDDRRTG